MWRRFYHSHYRTQFFIWKRLILSSTKYPHSLSIVLIRTIDRECGYFVHNHSLSYYKYVINMPISSSVYLPQELKEKRRFMSLDLFGV